MLFLPQFPSVKPGSKAYPSVNGMIHSSLLAILDHKPVTCIQNIDSVLCYQKVYHVFHKCSVLRETSRNLAIRCREHTGVSKTGYKMNNNSSAVYNHSPSTRHPVSPEDFSIISSTSNSMDLSTHESPLILRDRPNLNSQISSIQLTLF